MYFLDFAETEQLFSIFNKNHLDARFVGGCVRDGLHGLVTNDFDIAINCDVNDLCNILRTEGIKVITAGIRYLSIKIMINEKKYEITSLRKDLNYDGRHCQVLPVSDFAQDAIRRDFTINALYMDQSGHLFDYFDGQRDLEKNIVRFIGIPRIRMQEDYLRILRYYRFCSKYNDFSDRYADIISNLSARVATLSMRRIQSELLGILSYPHSDKILELMLNTKVLQNLNLTIDLNSYRKLLLLYPNAKMVLKLYMLFDIDTLLHTFSLSKKYKRIIKGYTYEIKSNSSQITPELRQDIEAIRRIKQP